MKTQPPLSSVHSLRSYTLVVLWLPFFALLPLSLLLFGMQVTRQASVEIADTNQAGSLRFRSLLVHGITVQRNQGVSWQPELATMESIRQSLRVRHPQEVARTDVAWNAFAGSLQRSGRVDWKTALQMRDAADRLTFSLEAEARRRHERASTLFLAGIATTIALIGMALKGMQNGWRAEQKRLLATATLQQREAQLQSIVNTAVDGIITIDVRGVIHSFNPAAERIFGYTSTEIVGRNVSLLMPEPEATAHNGYLESHERTGEKKIIGVGREVEGKRKDGSVFALDLAVSSVQQGDSRLFVGIARDITERKAAEERFRVLFEQSSDAHLLFDDTGIIDCNRAAVQMLRCRDKAEVLALHPAALSPEFQPDGRRSLEKCIEMDALARKQGYHRFEWLHQKMDGTVFPVEVTLTPVTIGGKDTLLVVWHDLTERKVAEMALRHSEARFHAFLDHGSFIAWITDADGHIEYLNAPYCAMIERPLDDCLGKTIFDLYPADAAQILLDNIRQVAQTGRPLETEESIPLPDGKIHHFLVHKFLLGDQDGRVLVGGSALDITERKETEQALQHNEKRLREAQRVARIGSWEFDVETGQISWSEEMFRLLEFVPEQGTPTYDQLMTRYHPEDVPMHNQVVQQAVQDGLPYEFDIRAVMNDNSVRWMRALGQANQDTRGRVIRLFGTVMDITAQKQAEIALRKSQEKLALAQQVARLGSWEYELATGKITWSPELFYLLGLDPAQGEPDYQTNLALYHPEDAARLDACVKQAIGEGKEYALDLRRAASEGTPIRWYHGVGKIERDATGQIVGLFGTLTDITERKAVEETIRQNQENLNHAQALAHVGSWERDYRTGTMTWSDELFRLCGLEPGSITPSIEALTVYTHPLDRERAQQCMREAMQSGRGAEIEMRFVGADDVLRYVFIRTEILQDETGQSIGSRGTVTDVTERVKALQEQTKFVRLIENSSDFIAIASLDGALLSINPAGRSLIGLECEEEVTATRIADFLPDKVWDWMQQGVLPLVMREGRWEGESQLINRATATIYEMQASFFLIHNPVSGEPMCLATVQRDISGQARQNEQLQQYLLLVQDQNAELEYSRQRLEVANAHLEALATTDGLTGAKNHRAFQEKLAEEFKRAERTCKPFSIILLDVDKFKHYNDSFGHPEGDRVLKQVVHALQATARETDFVARYGGEEFVVLLPDTGSAGALEAGERFRAAIAEQEWPLRSVTASLGVATLNVTVETGQQLIDLADRALYASKEAGRNRTTHAETLFPVDTQNVG